MKKKLVLVLSLMFVTLLTYSQAQLAVGLKAGPNFAKINTDESADANYKNRTGFHGGAFVLVKVGKIGIQPELIFSQQGSKGSFKAGTTVQELEQNYSYFNVPIILKVYLIAGLNIQAGPQFGFVTKASQTLDGVKEDVKSEMKKSDISAALGAGWDLPFGLTVDARYNLGLSKLYEGTARPEAKNQVFQLSLGYKLFKFGK